MLECVRPIAEPLSQIGCYLSGTNMGSILESSAVVDANGSYVFETVRTQYNQPLGGLPIPVGYVWKVIPYWCSMYSYQGVYSYPLAPPPYTCSPAERIFDLTGSVTGMDFFMWPTQ